MDGQQEPPTNSGDPFGFIGALNRHGYPFHYRTLKAAADAFRSGNSYWRFQVSEFPVDVRGRHSRIDFVLQWKESTTFLVAECKRANPKMKRWCFARAPYVRGNRGKEKLLAELINFSHLSDIVYASVYKDRPLDVGESYHIALELKVNDKKGDDQGPSGRGAIEEAATQVNVGVSGLIEHFRRNPPPRVGEAPSTKMLFLPVVFTTAELYASEVDMSEADIESGEIDLSKGQMAPKPWLFLQYPVSPGLRHSVIPNQPTSVPIDLGRSLEENYLRSVAIVQGKHTEEFLRGFDAYFDL